METQVAVDKTLITNLTNDIEIDREHKEDDILVRDVTKKRITLNATVVHVTLERCKDVHLEVNQPTISGVVDITDCENCEININSRLRLVNIENSTASELHYGDNAFFFRVHTKGSKHTTVCLPDACNLIPANKAEETLVAELVEGGSLKISTLKELP